MSLLDHSQIQELYDKVLEVPEAIPELSLYQVAVIRKHAVKIIEGCEQKVFDLFQSAPGYVEMKRQALIKENIREMPERNPAWARKNRKLVLSMDAFLLDRRNEKIKELETHLFDYLLNDDLRYRQASFVFNKIEAFKNNIEETPVRKPVIARAFCIMFMHASGDIPDEILFKPGALKRKVKEIFPKDSAHNIYMQIHHHTFGCRGSSTKEYREQQWDKAIKEYPREYELGQKLYEFQKHSLS